MISVNEIIQNSFQRCSLVGDGESATGTQAMAGLKDLQSLIAELNTENDVLENYETFDVYASNKIKFAVKPERWFEIQNLAELNSRIDQDLVEMGDIYKLKEPNNGFTFYTVRSFTPGQLTPFSQQSWNDYMKDFWANVWVEEVPDRVIGCARKIGNAFSQLVRSDKTTIDSCTKSHLPTQYVCETEIKDVNYPHDDEDLYKPYTIEYFVVEMDSNVAAPIRLTVLKGLPKFKLEDTLHLSSKYESLLEDGLCVKLCQRYKLMDIKSDFEKDFEDQKYKIKRINYANRPVIYNGFGKSWDTNFSNFAGGLGWG